MERFWWITVRHKSAVQRRWTGIHQNDRKITSISGIFFDSALTVVRSHYRKQIRWIEKRTLVDGDFSGFRPCQDICFLNWENRKPHSMSRRSHDDRPEIVAGIDRDLFLRLSVNRHSIEIRWFRSALFELSAFIIAGNAWLSISVTVESSCDRDAKGTQRQPDRSHTRGTFWNLSFLSGKKVRRATDERNHGLDLHFQRIMSFDAHSTALPLHEMKSATSRNHLFRTRKNRESGRRVIRGRPMFALFMTQRSNNKDVINVRRLWNLRPFPVILARNRELATICDGVRFRMCSSCYSDRNSGKKAAGKTWIRNRGFYFRTLVTILFSGLLLDHQWILQTAAHLFETNEGPQWTKVHE